MKHQSFTLPRTQAADVPHAAMSAPPTENVKIFTPRSLKVADSLQTLQRVLLVGMPHSGKTTSALTFPNVYTLDGEGKVPAGTRRIDFTDAAFVDSLAPRANKLNPPNCRDAFMSYVAKELPLFPADTTVIIESLTALDGWFHLQTERVDAIADKRALFGNKLSYFNQLFELLRRVPCRIIMTAHLQPVMGEGDRATGSFKAFLGGSFAEKLPGYFTACMLCERDLNPTNPKPWRWRLRPNATHPTLGLNTERPITLDTIPAEYSELIKIINP